MADTDYLESRLKELSNKTFQNEYITHTDFLSVSEQALLHNAMRKSGIPPQSNRFGGTEFIMWGGFEDAERRVCVFLPSYLSSDSFIQQESESPEVVSCLHISPVQARFADELSHRDYLGALMNLGIDRGQIGDILIDRTDSSACCFVLKTMTGYICRELCRVKHTTVLAAEIPPGKCTVRPEFEEREGSVASERLDAVLALVFRLARGKAQELIDREAVIVDGSTAHSGGFPLKAGSRVSVRGFGKFIYAGVVTSTKKGRLLVHVKVFK